MADSLFAEIVFDRPMDVPYSYAVPESLFSSIAVGKRVMVPFGRGDRATPGMCVRLTDEAPERATKTVLSVLDDFALVDDHLLRLTRWMADYYLCGWGQVLHAIVPAGVKGRAGTREAVFVEAVPGDDLPDPLPTVTPKQKLALSKLRDLGIAVEVRDLAKRAQVTTAIVDALVQKGLARKSHERIESRPSATPDVQAKPSPFSMSVDQISVWAEIETALKSNSFQTLLLHGVTGSGKTEIYLRAIDDVVKRGRQAIVLVPEISLTPQTIERFQGRFGQIAVQHSHLTDAERASDWRKIASGEIAVVVGARSAVFAPTRNLGLIVIDEEHETSFKQDTVPRYHARDVAVVRASFAQVPIILGSATPSLESFHNVKKGTYKYLAMLNRVEDRPLPAVHLIDMRHEPKYRGKFFAISRELEREMKKSLDAGGQVMLLLNRRGFHTQVMCPDCGQVANCVHCDLGLTFHRAKNILLCHHCGYEAVPITRCPKCQSDTVHYHGLGTEKLQQEVEEKFPNYVCRRMDSDTTAKPGSHRRILDSFRDGSVNVLVGTQMIAKGLDFPNVTLVGVVNADVGLNMPDFRAAERTFQLLAQVAGRTGRGDRGGHVFIQTFAPEHPCVALAAKHDYDTFATGELLVRRQHSYPPYHRMARVILRGPVAERVEEFADVLSGAFKQAMLRRPAGPPMRLLGPAECPIFKLNDLFRYHFQVQSESSAVLHDVLREVAAVAKPPHQVEFQIDVDPYSMT